MSNNPPQLRLSLPPSGTSAFKRSFAHLGWELDSPPDTNPHSPHSNSHSLSSHSNSPHSRSSLSPHAHTHLHSYHPPHGMPPPEEETPEDEHNRRSKRARSEGSFSESSGSTSSSAAMSQGGVGSSGLASSSTSGFASSSSWGTSSSPVGGPFENISAGTPSDIGVEVEVEGGIALSLDIGVVEEGEGEQEVPVEGESEEERAVLAALTAAISPGSVVSPSSASTAEPITATAAQPPRLPTPEIEDIEMEYVLLHPGGGEGEEGSLVGIPEGFVLQSLDQVEEEEERGRTELSTAPPAPHLVVPLAVVTESESGGEAVGGGEEDPMVQYVRSMHRFEEFEEQIEVLRAPVELSAVLSSSSSAPAPAPPASSTLAIPSLSTPAASSSSPLSSSTLPPQFEEQDEPETFFQLSTLSSLSSSTPSLSLTLPGPSLQPQPSSSSTRFPYPRSPSRTDDRRPSRPPPQRIATPMHHSLPPILPPLAIGRVAVDLTRGDEHVIEEEGVSGIEVPSSANSREQGRERNDSWTSSTSLGVPNLTRSEAPQHTTPLNPDWTAMFHPFEGFDLGSASGSGSTSSASGSASGSASTGAQRPYLGVDDEQSQHQQHYDEEEDEELDDMDTMEHDDPDQDDQEDEEEEDEEDEDEDEDEDAETYYSFAEDVELPGMDLDLGLDLGMGQTIIGGDEAGGGVVSEEEDEEVIVFTGSGTERNRAEGGDEEEETGDEQHEDEDEENDGEEEERTPTAVLQADYAGFRERLDSALERLRSPSPLVPEFAGSVGVGGNNGGPHRLPTPPIPSSPLEFAYRSQLPTLPIPPSRLELAHASQSRALPTSTIPPPRLELAYGSRRGAGPAPGNGNGFGSGSGNGFSYGFNGAFSGMLNGSGSNSFNESGSTSSNSNTHTSSFGTALRDIQREETRERETAQFLAALFGAATEEAEGDRGEEEQGNGGGGGQNEHARPFSSLSGTRETDMLPTNQDSQAYLNRNEMLAQRATRARISNAAALNDNASLMASIERQVSQATAVLSAQARAARAPDSGHRHLPAPRMRPQPDGGWNAYSDMAERRNEARRNEARQRELARAIVRERERQREGEGGREAEMQSQREAEIQSQRERARNLPMPFNLRESENSVPARRNFFDPTPVPGSLVRRMQTGLSSTNSTSTSASASASASGVNPGATQPQIQRRVITADQRAALMAGAWDDSRVTVTRTADGSGTSRAPSGPPTLPPLAMDSISSDDEYDGWIRDLELRRRSRAAARLSADADAGVTRNTERGPNSGDGSMHGGINATDNNASMVSAGSSTNSGTSTNPPATFSSSSSSVPIRVDHTPPSPLLTELHQLLAPSSSSATTTTNDNNASSNSFTSTHGTTLHDMSYFPIPRSNPPQINPNSFSWEREPPVDRAFQAILNYEGNGTFTVTPMEIESPSPPPQQQQQSQPQPHPQVPPQQQRARPTMPRTQTSSEWTRIGNEWGPVGSFGWVEENQVQSDRDQTAVNSQSNDSPAPYVPTHFHSLGLRRQQTDSSSGSSEGSSFTGNNNTPDRMADEVRGTNQRQNAHLQIMQEAMMRHQTTSLRGMQETRNQEERQRMASLRAQHSVWGAREDDEDATAASSSGGPERATARGNRLPLESATRLQTQEQSESTYESTSWMVRPMLSGSSSASAPRPLPLLSRPTPPRIRTNSSSSSNSGVDHPLFPPRPRRLRPQASTSLVGENASEIRNLNIRDDMRRQLQNQRLADDLDLIAMHRHQHNVRQVHRLSRERESDASSRAAAPQQHVRDARPPVRPVVRPRLHLPPPTQRVRPSSPPRIGYRLVPGSENAQRQRDQPSFRTPPFARYNNPIPSSPERREFGDLESSDEDWGLRRTQNNAPSLPSPDLGGWNGPMIGQGIFEDDPMETRPQNPRSDARMSGLFDPPSGGGWMDTTPDDQSSNAVRSFMQWEEHSPPSAPENLPTTSDSNTFAGLNPDMFADGPFRTTIRTMAEARRRRELREQAQTQSHSTAPSGSSQRAADPPSLPPLSLGDSDFSFRIQPSRPHATSDRMENSQVHSDPFFRRTSTSFTPEQVENLPRANGGARLHPQHHRFLGNHRAAVNPRSDSTNHSAQPRTRGATEGFSHAIEVLRGDGLSGPRAEQMINRFMDDHDPADSGWDVSYNTIGANFTRRENPAEEGTPEEMGRGRLRANRSRPRSSADTLLGFRRRRALGDYMRDEDFDTSYEGLLTLAATLGEVKPKATPGEVLATLETGLYKDWATPDCDKRCPICLDDYESTSTVLKLRECSHWMHRDCLQQWLGTANTCPVCRKPVSNQSAPRARPRYTGFRFRPPPDQPGSNLRRFPRDPPGPGDPGFGPSGNLPLPSFPPWG